MKKFNQMTEKQMSNVNGGLIWIFGTLGIALVAGTIIGGAVGAANEANGVGKK